MSELQVSAERQRVIAAIISTPSHGQLPSAIKYGPAPGESDAIAERARCLRLVLLAGSAAKSQPDQVHLISAVKRGLTAEQAAAQFGAPWSTALAQEAM